MKSRNTWNTLACFAITLLNSHLISGTVKVTTNEEPYIGESFTMICAITPFSGSATWAQDTTAHTNCAAAFCSPSVKGNYTFINSATGITVTINPVSSSDQGLWRCTHGSENDTYSLLPKDRPSKPSEDSSDTAAIVGGTAGAVLGIGGTLGIVLKVCKDKKKKEGSHEEQNKDKKDKKKDKKDKKKGSDEEQNKVEHIDERQPKHGTYDSLLAEDKQIVPPNRLPPINKEEIKKEKEKETNENKTK